jgi:hypothetical protein
VRLNVAERTAGGYETIMRRNGFQSLEGGQLKMETTGPSSQGVFRTVGDDNYVHVIMPMFVQW